MRIAINYFLILVATIWLYSHVSYALDIEGIETHGEVIDLRAPVACANPRNCVEGPKTCMPGETYIYNTGKCRQIDPTRPGTPSHLCFTETRKCPAENDSVQPGGSKTSSDSETTAEGIKTHSDNSESHSEEEKPK